MNRRTGILSFFMAAIISTSYADCLGDLSKLAEQERTCLIKQSKASECDAAIRATVHKTQECHHDGLATSQTTYAVQQGFTHVVGDPNDSPYRKALARQVAHNMLINQSDTRWQTLFHGLLPEVRDDNFDTSTCPLAFEGQAGRFVMTGYQVLPVRETLGIDLGSSLDDVTHLFVTPMHENSCYGIANKLQSTPLQADQPGFIYNLNQSDLDLLQQKIMHASSQRPFQGQIFIKICRDAASCLAEQQTLSQQWDAFQKIVHAVSAEEDCARYAQANAEGEINLTQINHIDCNASNLKQQTQIDQNEETRLKGLLFDKP